MNWVAGWNYAGYSPEPDDLYVTDDWASAVSYLIDTIENWWDGDTMGALEDDEIPAINERYEGPLAELQTLTEADKDREIGVAVADERGYYTHFWVDMTDEEPSDDY